MKINSCNIFDSNAFEIKDKDKTFKIVYAPNLDLYIQLGDGSIITEEDKTLTFEIAKDNWNIYNIFDNLYNDIINGNILNSNYKDSYQYRELVDKDFNITWISDDGLREAEDKMIISKDDDKIVFTFIRNSLRLPDGFKNHHSISIRIRNSGSYYDPFNCAFMKMYNELSKINLNDMQISIEEYLYLKKEK